MPEQRILVVSPSWVGDMVMSQTLFSLLKERNPDVLIDVIAPAASKPLLARMAAIHRAVLFDVDHGEVRFGFRRRFARTLRSNGYDQAIVLPNSLKSALVPFFAGIARRTGYLGEARYFLLNDIRSLDKQKLPRMIDRFMGLGLEPREALPDYEPPVLTVDEENQQDCLRRFGLGTALSTVGLCPGAEFGDAKRWPERHFATLMETALDMGKQVWLFGSARDREITSRIIDMVPSSQRGDCHNLAGRTTLLDAIDLLNLCERVVTNDSGLMHIAAAVGCRLIVLYGSTSADFTPPLTTKASALKSHLACSPCFKPECPLGHKDCLNQLLPEDVSPLLDAP